MSNPQPYTITAGDLRVVFEWRKDRWAHRVDLIPADGDPMPLFASVEGTPESSAPSSPPIQELQPHDDGQTLLGVGMAGRNHWSLTCGVRQVGGSPSGAETVSVEVACRVKGDAPFLASTYRARDGIQILVLNDQTIALAAAGEVIRIHTLDATAATTEGKITVHARAMPHASQRTVRWSYEITPTTLTEVPQS